MEGGSEAVDYTEVPMGRLEPIEAVNITSEDGQQHTLYVHQMQEGDIIEEDETTNTQVIQIIQDEDYTEMDEDEESVHFEDGEDDPDFPEGGYRANQSISRSRIGRAGTSAHHYEPSNSAKKHGCGEEGCGSAYRSKKSLVQHLSASHGTKLATFERNYTSVAHILHEFERIQKHANYLFASDYKTFNSVTKLLRVIYICAHDRKLRKTRQQGQVCTAHIEFIADYNTGYGSLSGCLQHYKHSGCRDLHDYQFVSEDDVPEDYVHSCVICCEEFPDQQSLLAHAFEKIHHIAPRFIKYKRKNPNEPEITTSLQCDMCDLETTDKSYFMSHRIKMHMSPDVIEKHTVKTRKEANMIFRQAQEVLGTRFILSHRRVNDSSIVSYSFRCNYNKKSLNSICVCSLKMLEFPSGDRFEIEIVKAHTHDIEAENTEGIDDLPPAPDLSTCETCDRVFQSESILKEHQKMYNHFDVAELAMAEAAPEVAKRKNFHCSVCQVGFTKKLSLRLHQKKFNHDYSPARIRAPITSSKEGYGEDRNGEYQSETILSNLGREKKVIQLFPNLCYDCDQTLPNKVELLKHLNSEHAYEVDFFKKEFQNIDQLWRFFYEVQIHTKTRYKQHGSQKMDEDNFKIYYICNREGKDKTKKANRLRSRRKPLKEVNRACTAHFTIRKELGKISCTGSTTHYGHDIEEEFLLRGKILQKALEIIQKVPDEATGETAVLTRADFPYHCEKRDMQRTFKHPEIPWSQPFSDTFTVTPIDETSYHVGPTNKPPKIVSTKETMDAYCSICAASGSQESTQCPHIYQCNCDFYVGGLHNCKHINVLELYLNQESNQDNVLYLTAPCSEEDLAIRRQASKLAQLSEDVIKILENLNACEESTKFLTTKMEAIKRVLNNVETKDEEVQTDASLPQASASVAANPASGSLRTHLLSPAMASPPTEVVINNHHAQIVQLNTPVKAIIPNLNANNLAQPSPSRRAIIVKAIPARKPAPTPQILKKPVAVAPSPPTPSRRKIATRAQEEDGSGEVLTDQPVDQHEIEGVVVKIKREEVLEEVVNTEDIEEDDDEVQVEKVTRSRVVVKAPPSLASAKKNTKTDNVEKGPKPASKATTNSEGDTAGRGVKRDHASEEGEEEAPRISSRPKKPIRKFDL